jgi:hypothetical protein
MADSRNTVLTALEEAFPRSDASELLEVLDRYGVETYEKERDRVHLAIIQLAAGEADWLTSFVQAAKVDYRDVLFWAAHGPLSPEEGAHLRDSLRRLLKRWKTK